MIIDDRCEICKNMKFLTSYIGRNKTFRLGQTRKSWKQSQISWKDTRKNPNSS